jgi:hypothetical protein
MADNDNVLNEVREETPEVTQEDPTSATETVQADSEQTDPVGDQVQEDNH